jgi:ribonuclease D
MKPTRIDLPAGIARLISREDMARLPVRRYEGKVCLVATPQDLDDAGADFAREGVVGLDTETRPSFRKGESHPPALVQAATARAVYLFPLRNHAVFPAVAALLSDARIVKTGIALAYDLRALKGLFPFAEQNVLDLGVVAHRAGMEQTGVRNLAGILLGLRIPKGAKTSNWAAPQLSESQVAYAATDAWICRELYLRFQALGLLRAKAPAAGSRVP